MECEPSCNLTNENSKGAFLHHNLTGSNSFFKHRQVSAEIEQSDDNTYDVTERPIS